MRSFAAQTKPRKQSKVSAIRRGSMTAEVIELAKAQISAKERARIERRERELAAGNVEIRTRHDALQWGGEWQAAYLELERNVRKVVDEYEHRLLMLRSDLLAEQCHRLIERIELQDEIKRLRGLI